MIPQMIEPKPSPSPTAFLTGLRGLAALIVAFTHLIAGELELGFRGYFAEPEAENRSVVQLFPFRIIFADQAMVALFFIVSAYSISVGPLKRRDAGNKNSSGKVKFYEGLAGSLVRRPIRLYLPVLVLEFVSHILFALGFYPATDLRKEAFQSPAGIVDHFFGYLVEAVWPFTRETAFPIGLNIQIWTIPAEFRGSCVVFLVVFMTAGVGKAMRMTFLGLVALMSLWHEDWVVFTFLCGLVIAEINNERDNLQGPTPVVMQEDGDFDALPIYEKASVRSIWKLFGQRFLNVGNGILCLVGLYLLSIPEQPAGNPWSIEYSFLKPWTPSDPSRFPRLSQMFRSIGGVLFIFTISQSPVLQKPFNSKPIQYLGRISFGLYLVHILVYKMMRDGLIQWFWYMRGEDNAWGWIGAGVVLTPIIWGISHVFWVYVDEGSVRAARWVDDRVHGRR